MRKFKLRIIDNGKHGYRVVFFVTITESKLYLNESEVKWTRLGVFNHLRDDIIYTIFCIIQESIYIR